MLRTRLSLPLLLYFLLAAVAGCGEKPTTISSASPLQGQHANKSAPASVPGETRTNSVLQDDSTAAVTADDLYEQFKKDEKATIAKYARVTLQVTGVVRDVDDGPGGRPTISLKAGGDIVGLTCLMEEKEPWAKVTAGQKVTLRGHLPPSAIAPAIMDCTFADPAQKPAILLTAEELAKEFLADPKSTLKKYADKGMVVSGVVLKKEDEPGKYRFVLRGTDKVSIWCGCGGGISDENKQRFEKIEVGKQARVNGQLLPLSDEGSISLFTCTIITK